MSDTPDAPQGAKQETRTDEAPPKQAAPQPSQGQSAQEKQEPTCEARARQTMRSTWARTRRAR